MCGIAGFFAKSGSWRSDGARRVLGSMTAALTHRGPDAYGHWADEDAGVGLGHRRLSIIDLSATGAQPMVSRNERYVISFNGEIYNFQDLRARIDSKRTDTSWRGSSDTEVLLELISDIGLEAALAMLDGMFAFALWDRKDRTLSLARDPFGEKPLYYGWSKGDLVFGSELKALSNYPGFQPTIDATAVASFFKYSYIPSPLSIYRDVFKLAPASYVVFSSDNVSSRDVEPKKYWDMAGSIARARAAQFAGSIEEAERAVESLMALSCQRRMVADVPLGSLLSGGIDSSLVTALMQSGSSKPVQTFSIGMAEDGYNEAGFAKAVAGVLGTDHTELILDPSDVQSAIPKMPEIYDEPFADSSQVPTYLVSKMARERVTVALSGDGGDELFGGYNRYIHATRLWSKLERGPRALRSVGASAITALPMETINWLARKSGSLAPKELAGGRAGEKLHKLARVLKAVDEPQYHDLLLATSHDLGDVFCDPISPVTLTERADPRLSELSFGERAMFLDACNYMPGDILTKVDRASMAVSLELRTPFLNKELFELAWTLPWEMKVKGATGKAVLRNILYRHVPRDLVDRPKAGFSVPIGRWLKTGLRDWAESHFDATSIAGSGFLDPVAVRRRWDSHLIGRQDNETFLWSVLMFQGWLEKQGNTPSPAMVDGMPDASRS